MQLMHKGLIYSIISTPPTVNEKAGTVDVNHLTIQLEKDKGNIMRQEWLPMLNKGKVPLYDR